MNLRSKTQLAAQVLKVGKHRVRFSPEGLNEIKEAITKQDIRDLYKQGFIEIKEIKGRKTKPKRKTKTGPGKIRKTLNHRKQEYVKITRKLRGYIKELKSRGVISNEIYRDVRKKIKMRFFKSKAYLKEYLISVEKVDLENKLIENEGKKTLTKKKTSKTKYGDKKK